MAGSLRLTREQLAIITGGDPRAIKAFEDFFAAINNLGSHASTHEPGGADPLAVDAAAATGSLRTLGAGAAQASAGNHNHKLDDLAAPDDNTDLNATAAAHGLLPKLSGAATDALLGDGSWGPPSLAPALHVREVQAYNVNGGTFTSGADQTRVLNTVVLNEIAGASLASNQITLPAGTYDVEWSAPAFAVSNHWSWLYDTTGAAILVRGTAEYSNATYSHTTVSTGKGRITLAIASVLEIRHRCVATKATTGFGIQTSVATYDSVYTDVMIRKVA